MKSIIKTLEAFVKYPKQGLPEQLFLFITRITPMVNVDLLIKNDKSQTLLTWRDDGFWKPGWHIPGGIIRYKEKMADRINAVARKELNSQVKFNESLLAINEVIQPIRKVRGHFVSFLYECKVIGSLDKKLQYKSGVPKHGQWMWHTECPENLIGVHEMYRKFI